MDLASIMFEGINRNRTAARAGRVEILDAVGRAKALGLCLRRIWAVASSLPGGAERISTLIPTSDNFSVPSHNLQHHEHEQCTFDFCEHSRVDFTSVEQRHEKHHGKIQCNGSCNQKQVVLSARDWNEKAAIWNLDGQSLLDASDPYMAVSHVWADGTGAGTWGREMVNDCLWEFFCDIARDFQCEGIWWDTISIPRDNKARAKALSNMEKNYADARITLVHDLYLREWEWVDAETACFAIVMSPWYSRGWTALELAKSHKVKILFRTKNNRHTIKDLDVDILAKVPGNSPHRDLAQSISKLRNTSIRSVGDLLSVLGPRDTSKPRDLPIISGLLAEVDVSGGLSQQEVYQRILRKLENVAQGHLFHNSATMSSSGFSWCPSNILDMPFAGSGAELLKIRESGDVEGMWTVYPADIVKPKDFIWKDTHLLNQEFLKSALSKEKVDEHVLLLENPGRDKKVTSAHDEGPTTRALLVRFVRNEESTACCHFVGPVYFTSKLGSGNESRGPLTIKVRIGGTERLQEISGSAWDHLSETARAKSATDGLPTTEQTEATDPKSPSAAYQAEYGQSFSDEDYKDGKAILYSHKDAHQSLFENQCRLQIPTDFSPESHETMDLYVMTDHDRCQAFVYGHKRIIQKIKGQRDIYDSNEPGKLMFLDLDENGELQVSPDDDSARNLKFLASTALLLAIDLASAIVDETKGKAELLVNLLLSCRVPHVRNSNGQYPLHLAVERKNCNLIKKLLTDEHNPAPSDAVNRNRETAIHLAAKLTSLDESTLKLLVEKTKTEILDAKDGKKQQTALHKAAEKGNLNLAKALIDRGASMKVQDSDGRTPLYYAAAGNYHLIVRALLEHEDKPHNKRNDDDDHHHDDHEEGGEGQDDDDDDDGDDGDDDDDDDDGDHIWARGHVNEEHAGQSLKDAQESASGYVGASFRDQDMKTALWLAAAKGHTDVVDALICNGADTHAKDKHEQTPLMLAAQKGHRSVVDNLLNKHSQDTHSLRFQQEELDEALLQAAKGKHGEIITILHESGAKSGFQDSEGMTALHWSIEARDEATAKQLAEIQDNVDLVDHKSRSALILAAEKELNEVVGVLLRRNAEATFQDSHKRTVLHWVAMRGNFDIMTQLLRQEYINILDVINKPDRMGRTALHWAAHRNWRQPGAMALILNANPQFEHIDNGHCTPLILAAECGNLEAVKQLLSRGVSFKTTNKEGMTALDQAAINGHGDIVSVLLAKAPEDKSKMRALKLAVDQRHLSVAIKLQESIIDSTVRSSATKLILFMVCATSEYPPAVENFVKSITYPDDKDKNGKTALMLSVQNQNFGLMRALLRLTLNRDLQDTQGQTALMRASMLKDMSFLMELLKAGVDTNIQDNQGYTALHHAVESSLIFNVQILLLEGSMKLSIVDRYKRTALHIALEKRRWTSPYSHEFPFKTDIARRHHYNHNRYDFDSFVVRRHGINTLERFLRRERRYFDIDYWTRGYLSSERIYQVLVIFGAKLDAEDAQGQTPLHWAARNLPSVIEWLLVDWDPGTPRKSLKVNAQNGEKQTPLLLAAEVGHPSTVRALLGKGADANLHDTHGRTPLSQAARNGHEEVVTVLLDTCKTSLNLDARDTMGRTALLLAAENGHLGIVSSLLEHNADSNLVAFDGSKAWQKAMDKGYAGIVDSLLSRRSGHIQDRRDINEALILSSRRGWTPLTRVLLKRGADTSFQNSDRCTALHMAAMKGHREIVEMLLKKQRIFPIEDGKGRTALLQATEPGFVSIVGLLLNKKEVKADMNGWKIPGALLLAAEKGYTKIVDLILKSTMNNGDSGIDLNVCDPAGRTAMILAAANGNRAIVTLLLGRGADSNIRDRYEKTVLHHAAWGGYDDVVEILLEHNVGLLGALDKRRQSALHLAAERASEKVIDQLLKKRPNVNAAAEDGQTALHRAAWGGSTNVVALLCNSGADTLICDSSKNKPWQVAAEKGHEPIVQELLRSEGNLRDECISNKQGLIFAAEMGYAGVARLLLERKAEANTKDENGMTPLHWAMKRGDQAFIELLLEKDWMTTINALDKNWQTPLCHGVLAGQAAVVKMLLRGTADPNKFDKDGRTALHHAASQCDLEMVRILVDKKADVHARDYKGKKAWQLAAENGAHQVVGLLLEKEPDPDSLHQNLEELFLDVVKQGRVSMVQLLLENGVDKDAKDRFGSPAVVIAAQHGNHEVLDVLLSEKADPGIQDCTGKTPLMWAAKAGNTKIVSSILDNIDAGDLKDEIVNGKDGEGQSALLIALENKRDKVVKLLLDKGSPARRLLLDEDPPGINLNLQGKHQKTALHLAVEGDNPGLVKLLLKRAKQDLKDEWGRTPLLVAAEKGNKAVVTILLESLTNTPSLSGLVNSSDNQGRTALLVAAERGDLDMIERLLDKAAEKDHADSMGRTALFIATQNGNRDIVELLLRHDADQKREDIGMRTPLRLAVANGDKALVKIFLNRPDGFTQLVTELERPLRPGLFQLAVRSGNNEVLRLISDQKVAYEEKVPRCIEFSPKLSTRTHTI